MTPNLDLTGPSLYDFDLQTKRLVAHVGALLKNGEAERVRGIMEVLKPFNRSAHDAVLLAYAKHVNSVMAAQVAPITNNN
jgi:hypothetical protein